MEFGWHVLVTWSSGDIILSIISIKKENYWFKTIIEAKWVSQALLGYHFFQISCILVEYDLFNTTNLIQNLTYTCFGIILTQFHIHFSRQEHQIIELLYVSINSWDSQVLALTPFHFFFTVSFRIFKVVKIGTNGNIALIHWKKKAENLEKIESLKLKKVEVCSKEIRNIWRVNTIGTGG